LFGIHDPIGFEQGIIEGSVKPFYSLSKCGHKSGSKHRTHGLHWKEEITIATRLFPKPGFGKTSCGHDAMQVWMQREVLSPGVQHGDHAGIGAEMLRGCCETFHHTPCGAEQDGVQLSRFKQAKAVECFRQGEYDMEVRCGQQLRFSCFYPAFPLYLLTLGTMSIPTGIVAYAQMTARGT